MTPRHSPRLKEDSTHPLKDGTAQHLSANQLTDSSSFFSQGRKLELNLAALKQNENQGRGREKRESKAVLRPISPRSRNREFLVKTFQDEASSQNVMTNLRRNSGESGTDDVKDIESFAFWLLVEQYRKMVRKSQSLGDNKTFHKKWDAHHTRRFAMHLYTQYLKPTDNLAEVSSARSSLQSVSELSKIEIENQLLKSSLSPHLHPELPGSLFDAAQAEVWKEITKRISYSLFLKRLFHAMLTSEMEVEKWKTDNTAPIRTRVKEGATANSKEARQQQRIMVSAFLL